MLEILSGIRTINSALAIFEKVINKLREGIEKCLFEIDKKNEAINKNTKEKDELHAAIQKAKKVIKNIEQITQ